MAPSSDPPPAMSFNFQNYDSVKNEAWNVNALQDVQLVADIRGNGRGPADQILYDCYVSTGDWLLLGA